MPKQPGVRYGFEPEDRRQEGAIAIWQANQEKPGDKLHAWKEAKKSIRRHKRREKRYNNFRVSVTGAEVADEGIRYDQILLREIMDLLPYSMRVEVQDVVERDDDGRRIRRVGRTIREMLPGILKTDPPQSSK